MKVNGYVTQNKNCYKQLRASCRRIYWPTVGERMKDRRYTSSVVVGRRASIPRRHQLSASSAHDTAAWKQVLIFKPGLWLHATSRQSVTVTPSGSGAATLTHCRPARRHFVASVDESRLKEKKREHMRQTDFHKHFSKCKKDTFGK